MWVYHRAGSFIMQLGSFVTHFGYPPHTHTHILVGFNLEGGEGKVYKVLLWFRESKLYIARDISVKVCPSSHPTPTLSAPCFLLLSHQPPVVRASEVSGLSSLYHFFKVSKCICFLLSCLLYGGSTPYKLFCTLLSSLNDLEVPCDLHPSIVFF